MPRPDNNVVRKIRDLFMLGKSREQLWRMGFPADCVQEAIEKCELACALPSTHTRIFRCKQCRHKCYETHIRNGICKGCEHRNLINEQRAGRFQV